MSKLIDAVKASEGRPTLISNRLFDEIVSISSSYKPCKNTLGSVYKIGVKLEQEVILNSTDSEMLTTAIEDAKRAIIEAVFGEFRDYFYQIEIAAYQRDFDKVKSILRSFQDDMFKY